ncbi:phage replisome organizer N-terminal domain-containing protein [Clostridium senegalense]|uniref:phage replisome organizer N-terminal domain-containing protein n=1 Tax=Clostridium senegalense TaxID=1465809 RepID=UPI000288F0DD|nr:phage replisome organizer N-terminal domain-containing protein [Clostridium senegalense]
MAKDKKYYWLKMKEDFFEEDTIQWLEEQENGKDYCLFYLKLCLKSLKTNGILIRNVGQILVPYDVKKLASMTNTNADTVRIAMEVFKKIGLVQILENGEIYLSQLENMVGSESEWAKKKRQQRLNAKLKDNVPQLSPNCPTEIEIETEIDIENRDKDIEIETTTIESSCSNSFDETDINFEDLKKYLIENNFIRATDQNIKSILKGFPSWWIKEALSVAVFNSNLNLAYVYGILRNWDMEEKPKDRQKQKNNKANGNNGTFNNFEQREYDFDELEKDLLGWSDKEGE